MSCKGSRCDVHTRSLKDFCILNCVIVSKSDDNRYYKKRVIDINVMPQGFGTNATLKLLKPHA
jgi:hypothetical protein